MKQPKFILTNTGYLRMGMVELHKDLLKPNEECYGGGYYEFNFANNKLILSGSSYDFGKPKWNLFGVIKISASYRELRIVYVNNSWEEDFVLNEELQIEYVD